ncbi:transposase [Streptomyces phaeochromogenes]|uniref:transposase n=1 Tax=Streptomyces phaeochromogenes TaxID=1923 RepID=UPI003899C36D
MPLTDTQWARIEPLLPDRTPRQGGCWRDHREVIDAIVFKFQTGTQWVHLPELWRGLAVVRLSTVPRAGVQRHPSGRA